MKELSLLNLLKKYEGEVVTKDEIFQDIWKGEEDEPADWALNALIYRIRKKEKKYKIENHKKIGYKLIDG